MKKKYKYFVTDGAFMWGYNNIRDARKFAKHLAKTNSLLAVWIVNPKRKVLEEYGFNLKKRKVVRKR